MPRQTTGKRDPSLTLVIPVHNEEEVIPELLIALAEFKKTLPNSLSVFFVDDHSTDNTQAMLSEAASKTPWFSYFRLSRRSGSHIAVVAGLSKCETDCAVFIAADLQDPLELIPTMISEFQSGKDIVWGIREGRGELTWFQHNSSYYFHKVMRRVSGIENIPFQASFALMSRRSFEKLVDHAGPHVNLLIEVPALGFPVAHLSFEKRQRKKGVSKWSTRRKILALIDAVVASSFVPLRAMTYIGFCVSVLGFLYAFLLLTLALGGFVQVPGWASLVIIVLVIGGLQILMMGVTGEYIWRINENTQRRSLFLIEEEIATKQTRKKATNS
ncbi:MAG: glycosyltransferase [Pseudomonadota bacterium]